MARKPVRKFLNDTFADELTFSPAQLSSHGIQVMDGKNVRSEFTESHFLYLLIANPGIEKNIREYLKDPDSLVDVSEIDDVDTKSRLRDKIAAWRKSYRDLLSSESIRSQFQSLQDPFTPLVIASDDGQPGYEFPRFYSTTDAMSLGKPDVKTAWLNFIRSAKKELVVNVYDFDLEDVRDALIAKKRAGVSILLGIDKGVIEERPQVRAIYQSLLAAGVKTVAVDSVGLNHQKIAARDWSTPEAEVLLSSGNLTQSCIGPEGDLKGLESAVVDKDDLQFSIPNANHALVVRSKILAQIVLNELTKTLEMGLRGSDYPQSGMYRVLGKPQGGRPAPAITIAFSPRGGFGDLNRDFIKQAINLTSGPVKMLQFAFSSKIIEEALYSRALAERSKGHQFLFQSVGDTPFAMRDWSVFLSMSGYQFKGPPESQSAPFYIEAGGTDLVNKRFRWHEVSDIAKLRGAIKTAPRQYGTHNVKIRKPGGEIENVQVTAKIHHKVLLSDGVAIVGTSFNFSENAVKNQEQLVATNDPLLYDAANSMFMNLFERSNETVAEKVKWRNDPKNNWGGSNEAVDAEDGVGR